MPRKQESRGRARIQTVRCISSKSQIGSLEKKTYKFHEKLAKDVKVSPPTTRRYAPSRGLIHIRRVQNIFWLFNVNKIKGSKRKSRFWIYSSGIDLLLKYFPIKINHRLLHCPRTLSLRCNRYLNRDQSSSSMVLGVWPPMENKCICIFVKSGEKVHTDIHYV